MKLFGPVPIPDPEIEGALITPADWRDRAARKEIAKKMGAIRARVAECGGDLRGVAYSFYDAPLVITTSAFCGVRTGDVVQLSDLRSVDVTPAGRSWVVTIQARTGAAINYTVDSPSEAYTIQELLGFN